MSCIRSVLHSKVKCMLALACTNNKSSYFVLMNPIILSDIPWYSLKILWLIFDHLPVISVLWVVAKLEAYSPRNTSNLVLNWRCTPPSNFATNQSTGKRSTEPGDQEYRTNAKIIIPLHSYTRPSNVFSSPVLTPDGIRRCDTADWSCEVVSFPVFVRTQ